MKATTLIVLGGLMFAGTALAADPQQAATTTSTNDESASKVGFDASTGKLRRLTAAESAQLDAMTARQKTAPALAKGKGKTAAKLAPESFVAANGMVVTAEPLLVESTATIGADGKVVVTHGEAQQTQEAANE